MLSQIEVGLEYKFYKINVLSKCPFLRHWFTLYLEDRCTQTDWRRSCRPGSSNQGHTRRWGTRCHSHCSRIPGYRSDILPHSGPPSCSGTSPGDSLSPPSFLQYSRYLGDTCHLRRLNFSCIEVYNTLWFLITLNQISKFRWKSFWLTKCIMQVTIQFTSLCNPKRIPTAIRI